MITAITTIRNSTCYFTTVIRNPMFDPDAREN